MSLNGKLNKYNTMKTNNTLILTKNVRTLRDNM